MIGSGFRAGLVGSTQVVLALVSPICLFAQNPFFEEPFFPDPTARVIDGKVFLYPSHDVPNQKHYREMDGYHVLSSEDLVHWTDHGEFLRAGQTGWAANSLWAPDGGIRTPGGRYLCFFPARDKNDEFRTGLLSADNPLLKNWTHHGIVEGIQGIDPAVFVDDDGQAYIYSGAAFVGRLKPGLMELDGPQILMEDAGVPAGNFVPKRNRDGARSLEAQWVFKRKSKYYRIYNAADERCRWTTSDNPMGPWHYGGMLMGADLGGAQGHGSILEYRGQWYFFYHVTSPRKAPGVKPIHARASCADIVLFRDDGSIVEVVPTRYGVGRYDASTRIEAERFFEKSPGLEYREFPGFPDKFHLAAMKPGEWARFPNVDFGSKGKTRVSARIRLGKGSLASVFLGNASSGSAIPLAPAAADGKWQTVTAEIPLTTGQQTVTLQVEASSTNSVDWDWMEFAGSLQ